MDDLISRQAVLALPTNVTRTLSGKVVEETIDVEKIKALPPVHPRTGKWILCDNQNEEDVANGNYLYKCSECERSDLHAKTQKVPYCWWCGAIMENDTINGGKRNVE